MKSFINTLRYLSFPMIILGTLFKIQHWPYANILLVIAIVSMFLYFTLKYLVKGRLYWQDHVYFLLSTVVLVFVITRLLRWPEMVILLGVVISILIFLYGVFIKKRNEDSEVIEHEESLFDSNIGLLPLALVALGVGFKLLEIPGWGILFVSGLVAQAVHMFLIRSKPTKKDDWEDILDAGDELRKGNN